MFLLGISSYLLFGLARTACFVLVAALILVIFNPIGYELSYTLMTETFFGMAMTTSAYFLIRSLKEESAYLLALGTLAAIAAILCRQFGVCLAAGYLVARLHQDGSWARRSACALPPVAICILVALRFAEWLQHTGRLSANYYIVSGWIRNGAAHGAAYALVFQRLNTVIDIPRIVREPIAYFDQTNRRHPSGSSTDVYYASDGSNLWKFASGAWTELIVNAYEGICAVAVNPNNPTKSSPYLALAV